MSNSPNDSDCVINVKGMYRSTVLEMVPTYFAEVLLSKVHFEFVHLVAVQFFDAGDRR